MAGSMTVAVIDTEATELRAAMAAVRASFAGNFRRCPSDNEPLQLAWDAYQGSASSIRPWADFRAEIGAICAGNMPLYCNDCGRAWWPYEVSRIAVRRNEPESYVCFECAAADRGDWTGCGYCGRMVADENGTNVGGETWCEACCDDYASYCDVCGEYHAGEEHRHACECEPSADLDFTFPYNGHADPMPSDAIVPFTLPSGTIDAEGLDAITRLVIDAFGGPWRTGPDGIERYIGADWLTDNVGDEWTARRGNYPKRLGAFLARELGCKLTPEQLSAIGTIGREHTSQSSEWYISVTRDLNQPAAAFYNEGSCFWQSYAPSRCALKGLGGIGLRSYASPRGLLGRPNGRAWIIPLDDEWEPTDDAMGARGYLAFNGYGALDGWNLPRMVAALTRRTYRKVFFSGDPIYVNGSRGYLIASQPDCHAKDSINLDRWTTRAAHHGRRSY